MSTESTESTETTATVGGGPLSGVKVIELTGLAPAPFGCMVLADLGAEVIRVDRGGSGGGGLMAPSGVLDRSRKSIAVDLKTEGGREILLRLVETADVLVEGYRPGVAERLGIGPDECLGRNPRLVYARSVAVTSSTARRPSTTPTSARTASTSQWGASSHTSTPSCSTSWG